MHAIIDHDGIGEAAVRSFVAGCDVLLICKDQDRVHDGMQAMERAVQNGRITRKTGAVIGSCRTTQVAIPDPPYKPVTISDARLVVGMSFAKDAARFVA